MLWYEHIIEYVLKIMNHLKYLMDLAKDINNLILKLRVMNEAAPVAKARLLVLKSARIVLKHTLCSWNYPTE